MAWIKTIEYSSSTGALKRIYERVKGPNDNVDNVLKVHSLRPHTLKGHMVLYKSVLHNSNNELPKWYLESIGVYVSLLNHCEYCVRHHFEGLKRLIKDDTKADAIMNALSTGQLGSVFSPKFKKGLEHARKLTLTHSKIDESEIQEIRHAGFSDGEILEINQVASYFNYVNRTVVGLGVSLQGDILGLSPNDSDNPEDWKHQ